MSVTKYLSIEMLFTIFVGMQKMQFMVVMVMIWMDTEYELNSPEGTLVGVVPLVVGAEAEEEAEDGVWAHQGDLITECLFLVFLQLEAGKILKTT